MKLTADLMMVLLALISYKKVFGGFMLWLLVAVFLLLPHYLQANEASVGDFGSNQQAEVIDNSSETKVTQDGIPANTAVAPATPTYSQDVCAVSSGTGVQTQVFGLSFGSAKSDKVCELLKLSKQLQGLGLKVGAVSILCQDARVFWALYDSGTPCPTNQGLISDEAYIFYRNRSDRVPDRPEVYRADTATRLNSNNKPSNKWRLK